jgi:hypothetical protein
MAPVLMALGVAMLIMNAGWPAWPVATGVSLIALGATKTLLGRPLSASLPRVAIAVHLFVYASLYLLFIGALCDASIRAPRNGLTLSQVIDLGLSAGVMAFVARTCVAATIGDEDASGGDAQTR